MSETSSKATAAHLRRDAYLYVRQSTLYQVFNNTESTLPLPITSSALVGVGLPGLRMLTAVARSGALARLAVGTAG